jgi:hypothetical protein
MKRIAIPVDAKTEAQAKAIALEENVPVSKVLAALMLKGLQHHLCEKANKELPE